MTGDVEAAVVRDVRQFLVTGVITIATESVTCSVVTHSRHLVTAAEYSISAISDASDNFLFYCSVFRCRV